MDKVYLAIHFLSEYDITNAIDRIDAAINGTIDEQGKRISTSRELHPLVVNSWFKEHMPPDWKLKESLLFTAIEAEDEVRTLNYEAFVEMVKKGFEVEKERLAGLPEDNIVKEAQAKIQKYLFSQYRIRLGEGVDPLNWDQVQKAIEAQLNELRGGYRGLLEQPGKLAEIKNYIDKLKGRENYSHEALRSLLSQFGIIAPSRMQDWEAVKESIENMRRQEYCRYRDTPEWSNPRQTIANMLVEMGVAVRV